MYQVRRALSFYTVPTMSVEMRSGAIAPKTSTPVRAGGVESGYRPLYSISTTGQMTELSRRRENTPKGFSSKNGWSTIYKRPEQSTVSTKPENFKRTFDTRGFKKITLNHNPFSSDRTVSKEMRSAATRIEYKRPEVRTNWSTFPTQVRELKSIPVPSIPVIKREVAAIPPLPQKLEEKIHPDIHSLWNETQLRYFQKKNNKHTKRITVNPRMRKELSTHDILQKIELQRHKKYAALHMTDSPRPSEVKEVAQQNNAPMRSNQERRDLASLQVKKINLPKSQTQIERQLLVKQAHLTLHKMRTLGIPHAEESIARILQHRALSAEQVHSFLRTYEHTSQRRTMPKRDATKERKNDEKKVLESKENKKKKSEILETKTQRIIAERDITTDRRRIQTAVRIGQRLLASQVSRQSGVSGEIIAKHMPTRPGARLSSRIRHQLKLPLESEAQYDAFKSALVSKGSIKTAEELSEAARRATNFAPAVQLNKHVTSERVRAIDEVRATSGGVVIYQQ